MSKLSRKHVVFSLCLCMALSLTVRAIVASAGSESKLGPDIDYNPRFDVSPPYGVIDVVDIQGVARYWNTTGVYTGTMTAWELVGNAGTVPGSNFVGTVDNTALELRVNGLRALRLEPNLTSPNLIGGYSGNSLSTGVAGAAMAGGGATSAANRVTDDYGAVGGGTNNQAGNNSGAVGDVPHATVGGGTGNTASGRAATIPGGSGNTASGSYSFAAGYQAGAKNDGTFVWADATGGNFNSVMANTFVIRASNGVGIGTNSPKSAFHVVGNYVQIPARAGAPPAADCDQVEEAGRVIGRTDGTPYVYICRGPAGWTGVGLQEAQSDSLQARLEALEAQNADLQARLAALEKALVIGQE